MDRRPTVGSRVRVARFRCHGTVSAERYAGHELSVRLDPPLGLLLWLKRPEVALLEADPSTADPAHEADQGGPELPGPEEPVRVSLPGDSTPPSRPESGVRTGGGPGLAPTASEEQRIWRRRVGRSVIEALRFGIVPRYAVEALSVGLEAERRLFASDLDRVREGGAIRVVSAPYGSGKSHALDIIQAMALQKDFVVARADLDAFECPPNHPRNIFRALMKSLRIPGTDPTGRGLAALLDRAARSRDVLASFTRRGPGTWHEFLGPALLNWQGLPDEDPGKEDLYQWISGEDVDLSHMRSRAAVRTARQGLLSLGSYTTLSSHFTYMLGGISVLARQLGFSGLVILLDEAEHLRLLSVEMEARAVDFLKGLVASALGPDLPRGYLAGSYLGGRKKIPFCWQSPANLYLVAACTPIPGTDDLLRWLPDRSRVTVLPDRLDAADLESLIERIATTYRWAFPDLPRPAPGQRQELSRPLRAALESGALKNLRQVVQTIVGGLDLVRARPAWGFDRVVHEVTRYAGGPSGTVATRPAGAGG